MINIFSIKSFTGNPADGIDNVNIAVFSRLASEKFRFLAEAPSYFKERGSIKKIELSGAGSFIGFFKKIIFLRRVKPDYLFGIGLPSDLIFILFKPAKTKYLIDWHTVLINKEGFWRVRAPWWLRKLIFNQADLVIAVSEFSAVSVRKYFPRKKVAAILNGVDLEFFNPNKKNEKYLKEKYQIDFSRPLMIFIGALHLRKRPDLFIELAKNYSKANFVVVGRQIPIYGHRPAKGGTMSQKLNNFQWIEKMPREDVAVLLASSRAFVFPSLNEASAAVILESMASGCVPIVSKSGGNPEFLKNGESGFLIESGKDEKKEFLEKIDLLLNNKPLWQKMSLSVRQEAGKHSWDRVAKEYEKVLYENNLFRNSAF